MKKEIVTFLNNAFPLWIANYRYEKCFGEKLNFNNPQDLNAKILWLSLFSDTREWSRLSDKYAVREFIKERGCEKYLVKLYGHWDNVDDIEWSKLPNEFILKSNTGSGNNIIVEEKSKLDIEKTKSKLKEFLVYEAKPRSSEFQYVRIKPCIIAEELLHNDLETQKISSSIIDYKIWCFNGKPFTFFIGANRQHAGMKDFTVNFYDYDLNWVNHPEHMKYDKHHQRSTTEIPRPKNIEEMLQLAKKLSAKFPIVRVDLYNLNGCIYFGEMTFTSNGGIQNFYTFEFAKIMGMNADISMISKCPEHWRGK